MPLQSINPATGETRETFEEISAEDVRKAIEEANAAWKDWRRRGIAERAHMMRKAADILREGARDYGRLMSEEMGKPIAQAVAEAEKCAWCCDYYADNAGMFLAPEIVETGHRKSLVTFKPLGVILAVMPWNFPFWQAFRFAAPSLMAGNAAVLKHASNVPACALATEDVFRKAGFPEKPLPHAADRLRRRR
ncbi:aldehyde dehydrogenase family protein [Roseibium salinum]|nr:aldehyde dehydrogenase family protein [Roseibium salinum]